MSLFFCIQANSNLLWHIKFLACIYNIKNSGPISRVLCTGTVCIKHFFPPLVIYPLPASPPVSIVLPSGSDGQPFHPHKTARTLPVYANFQHPECTARMLPYAWWALAPPSHPYLYNIILAVIFFCTDQPSLTPTR